MSAADAIGARSAFSDPDFRRLWTAFVVGQVGSAFGAVAIPLVAIRELGLEAGSVALLATASALVLLMASFPAGYIAEFRRKRPVMVTADLLRAVSFGALALLLATGTLGFTWLVVALGINAAMQILFTSASSAHTKDLLPARLRADALGKLQAAAWTSMIAGPAAAGVVAGLTSPAVLLVGNGVGFVTSALLVRSIRRPEGAPPVRASSVGRVPEAVAGARFLVTQPLLRRIFVSWLIFAGAIAAMSPVTQVFYLQDLDFSPQEYGLLMGLPSVGGLLGAWLTGPATHRWGVGRTLWWSSVLRSPWYFLFPLAPGGTTGLVLLILAFTGVLFFSSITNSAMAALRMDLTPDRLMSRASAAWMVGTMGAGPVLIPAVGLVMQHLGARSALWVVAGLVVASLLILPAGPLLAGRQVTSGTGGGGGSSSAQGRFRRTSRRRPTRHAPPGPSSR